MAIEDWRGVLVTRDIPSQIEGYRRIFEGLNITDVQTVYEDEKSYQESYRKVKRTINLSDKKPLVIGFGHYLITEITDDSMDHVYFDAHADDYDKNLFHHGSFINYMKGRHFCIGARKSDYKREEPNSTLLRFDKPEEISQYPFRNKIFFSYDTDVFHPNVTVSHSPWDFPQFEGKMFPHQVKDLSARISNGREIYGIAIVEYSPNSGGDKTSDMFVDILKPLL